jgi:ATP-binding cassette, subfamily B (MDR/TAP), member 1
MKNVNLFFAAGETTFVIGKSGSGKSTIGQILSKFYSLAQGSVSLDSVSIQALDTAWLRQAILLVEQQSVLFGGTIQENIALGTYEVSWELSKKEQEHVLAATNFAMVRSVIEEMPRQFKTQVGSKGTSLSGGQRQRIALARAWLRNPSILILDESTSALDYINRMAVMDAIRKWRKGKTTIIITHDISQILPEDFIYVMKDGCVVQEGYRKYLDNIKDSPFHEFLKVEDKGRGHESSSDLDEPPEPPPKSPEFPQRNISVAESTLKSTTGSEAEVNDLLNLYIQEPGNRKGITIPTLFSYAVSPANKRQSVYWPPVVAPFWRVVPPTASPDWVSIYSTGSEGTVTEIDYQTPKMLSLEIPRQVGNAAMQSIGKQVRRFSRLPNVVPLDKLPLRKDTQDSEIEMKTLSKRKQRRRKRKRVSHVVVAYSMRNIIATIWREFSALHRVFLILAVCFTVVYAVSTPMFSFIWSKLLATLYNPVDRKESALRYSLGVLGISIIDGFSIFTSQYLLQCCGQLWVNTLRIKSLRLILAQPRQFFDEEQNEAPRLAECLDQHGEEMQHILGRFLGYLLIVTVMLSVSVIWSLITCWKLTLVILGSAPVMYGLTNTQQLVTGVMDKRAADFAQNAGAIFNETFTSIKTVRSLCLEEHFRKKYRKATDTVFLVGIQRAILCGIVFGLSESALFFLMALLFYYGSVLLASREFGLNAIMRVIALLSFSVSNTTMILSQIPGMSIARDAAGRLLRLASLPETCHEHEGTVRIRGVGDIMLQNVNFSYPSRPDNRILRNVSLTIPVGHCIVLVGLSGSGKSTIASLLLNLYPTNSETPTLLSPTDMSADITFSHRSIRRIHTPTLRSLISIVTQTPTLLPATVAENIAYGLHDTSPLNTYAAVEGAARAAGIHDFIVSLPQGYDTLIGEGGTGLSGGQAQRIAIARALVRRPNVLILDEATSALDVESAALIRDTVKRLLEFDRRQREPERGHVNQRLTVIIITHSREMMKIADRICMLDKGRVVETGPYGELVRRGGAFAALVRGKAWDKDEVRKKRESLMMLKRASGIISH